MLTPVEEIAGEDDDETGRLRKMADDARAYITAFRWCPPIKAMYFADGVGGVVALFLVTFDEMIGGTDDRLWVVVGDLPSVYMVAEIDTAKEALEAYCELMDDWVHAVLVTHDFSGVFPGDAAATPGNAESLQSRLAFLRENVIPDAPTESIDA